MALGSLAAAAATAAASTAGSALASKFLGGKKSSSGSGNSFAGFTGGGLSGTLANGNVNVAGNADRWNLVGNISKTFPKQAAEVARLRGLVAPGVSALRQSRLGEVEDSRSRAIGNLRENLQRRRVLGSSFGQDTISRAEAEFARERERVAAESSLQELELTHAFIAEEFNLRRGEFQTSLDELNLQADLAAKLSGQATAQLGAMAQIRAQIAANEAQLSGAAFGKTFQPVFDEIGKAVGGTPSAVSSNSSIARAA